MTSLGRRRRARKGDDDGAVAVEAALIFPVLILLIFGMLEFALLARDHVATTSLVRAGARIASAEAKAGQDPSQPNTPVFASDASLAIQRQGSALPKDNINFIWVYKANAAGFPGSQRDFASCPAGSCVEYRWDKALDKFTYRAGSWRASAINSCAGKDASGNEKGDYVGVYLNGTHKSITGVIPGFTRTVSDYAVMKFEPTVSANCAGT